MLADRGGQPDGKPDGEHRALFRDRDPAACGGLGDVTAACRCEQPSRPASTRAASAAGVPASSRTAASLTCAACSAASAQRSPGMT